MFLEDFLVLVFLAYLLLLDSMSDHEKQCHKYQKTPIQQHIEL